MQILGLFFLIATCSPTLPERVDDELAAYVEARRKVIDDAARPMAEREAAALDLASTLDRSSASATTSRARRAAWSSARSILEGFTARNPDHPQARLFAFQAAVYEWAEGRNLMALAEEEPDRAKQAEAAFARAVERGRPIVAGLAESDSPLAQNARYRLAQSLRDLAVIRKEREDVGTLRREALGLIVEKAVPDASLSGYVALLRAQLLAESGRFREARSALDEASRASAKASEREVVTASVHIADGLGEFEEARSKIAASSLPDSEKARLRLSVALAERAACPAGDARTKAEAAAFEAAEATRGTDRFASALRALAEIDEPAQTQGLASWSLLAEAAAKSGQADRGVRLDLIAADRAEAKGEARAAAESRFRAATVAFGAGRFARADEVFSRVAADAKAGDLRARAGMLRALARGRLLARGGNAAASARYASALSEQIRDFPDDPATGEARWLLAGVRLDDGDRAGAESLWASVPRAHPRWLDARLAMARLREVFIDERRLVDDGSALAKLRDDAIASLERDKAEARDESERIDFELERARLDLAPGLGDPRAALARVDRVLRLPLLAEQRDRSESLRIVAMAAGGRSLEAERAASEFSGSPASRLTLARDLDHWAAWTSDDQIARRIGGTERIAADRLASLPGLPASAASEARLRSARGRMLAGDAEGAISLLAGWADPAADVPSARADVADLLAQGGEPDRAFEVYRRISKSSAQGSPPWFAARLGQARALFASGHVDAARRLVEGTELLNPDLGGPAMRREFANLRAKLRRR